MKISNSFRAKVATLANYLFHTAGLTQSAAWGKAWKVCKLKAAMQDTPQPVNFAYEKKNGVTRYATGTLHAANLPTSKGTGRKTPTSQIIYFDTGANAYRSFKAQNFLSVTE